MGGFGNKITGVRRALDLSMAMLMLLLMSYLLVGQSFHELFGTLLLVLLIVHHILNYRWYRHLGKGKWSIQRILTTILNFAMLIFVLLTIGSGIAMSRVLFKGLDVPVSMVTARQTHMLCSNVSFLLMALHLGFHWKTMADRLFLNRSQVTRRCLRIAAALVAIYGVYAFLDRGIPDYLMRNVMFYQRRRESLGRFLVDYVAISGLMIWISYYLNRGMTDLRRIRLRRSGKGQR